MVAASKKLLILDVNGLLIDTYFQGEPRPDRPHDAKVNRFYVYKRNGCEEFVQFCLENFVVGVWSSAREHNVISLVEFMFKESREKLAFIWHQMHCTDTKLKHPDNIHKPVFLKELSKLWDKSDPDLPWEKGDFGPSNTVLIDDSPYKALRNPPHTGIFPETYKATDVGDNYLVGELRNYLEGLLGAADVQVYIENNPFGVPRLAHGDHHYHLFSSVMDATEIPALPGQPPVSPKQEEKVVAVANTAGDIVVASPDTDVIANSKRRRTKGKFGSTAEESLEYCATEHVQSPRDFAKRLSRAVEASQNVTCEADPLGGANPPAAEGILGRPPSLRGSQKSSPLDTSYEKGGNRSCSRQRGHREREFHAQSQRRVHADARNVQRNPHNGRRISVISVDGRAETYLWRSRGGHDSQQNYKERSFSDNHWISPSLDPQLQYRGHAGAIDTAVPNRWDSSGAWQERERGWDPPAAGIRNLGACINLPGRLSAELPLPPYVEFNSRPRVQGGAPNRVESYSRRGWSRDNRSLHRGLSPNKGTPRDREGLLKDKVVERGRPRERESVHRESLRDPEFSRRIAPRAFEISSNTWTREHEVSRRAVAVVHEDYHRSYARPAFSHHPGYTRGRTRESVPDKNPQASDHERVRGRSRRHENIDRTFRKPSHISDFLVEEVPNSVSYSEYDTYRQGNKAPRTYDEGGEDTYGRSSSRNWRETERGHSGPSKSHVRKDVDLSGRSARMSSRHFEQAHSRGRKLKIWER